MSERGHDQRRHDTATAAADTADPDVSIRVVSRLDVFGRPAETVEAESLEAATHWQQTAWHRSA